MNGTELARQLAAILHEQAVQRGQDPWHPYAFAVAEANRNDIDVESVDPSAHLLNGGRAVFLPSDRLILHENSEDQFTQAFLVAHEIGHALLGDGNGEVDEIDPARAAEPSAVGSERVVDYGRRQRREIQMDLFAREFLLPRPLLKKLHLEENLSATAIAERIGAPFDVVAQQLLDALLLPLPEPPKNEGGGLERTPNLEQLAAINHAGPAYLLEAGPGTGKTQTLTSRVMALLEKGIDPRRILLLTFSNKAAGEMADRIAAKNRDAASAMWIGTFHAFGLDIIRRFHSELGLPKDPRIVNKTEAVALIEDKFPSLSLRHHRNIYDPNYIVTEMLSAISRAKDEVVDHAEYKRLSEAMLGRAVTDEEVTAAERALEVSAVYSLYETLKSESNRVDFGDLVLMPVRLLEENQQVREHFQGLFDHILVDEYQDVNRSSVRLLQALSENGDNLWVVGDAKQSIYRFRGASSISISQFGHEDFSGARRGYLRKNYRSVEEVVNAFSAFAGGMNAVKGAEAGLLAERGSIGLLPELRTVDTADDQIAALTEAVEDLRESGYRYRDQAILCTGNETLSKLARALERSGIPVLFLGSLFERSEVRDLFALLSVLADRRAMGLVRLACIPEFRMPLSDVSTILEELRNDNASSLLHDLELPESLSSEGKEAVASLIKALHGFDSSSSPWEVLSSVLLDRTRIVARLGASASIADRTRGIAVWQAMNFIRSYGTPPGSPIVSLQDYVRSLVRLGDDRELRQLPEAAQNLDAVRLMTIHGAKGLEFPVVHLPGMSVGTIPSTASTPMCPPPDGMLGGEAANSREASRVAHNDEQECIFYVALSRARDRLLLYAPLKTGDGRRRAVSAFVERLGEHLSRRHLKPKHGNLAPTDETTINVLWENGVRFEASKVALYESCPRRFFYTHVLQIGGRRKSSAFAKMHDAVRSVITSIIGDVATPCDSKIKAMMASAFVVHGLAEHGYASELETIALEMALFYASTRRGHTPMPNRELSLRFTKGEILVRADEALEQAGGAVFLRRVRTGHQRTTEDEDLTTAAFLLAAMNEGSGARVEILHLADGSSKLMALTDRKLENRRLKLTSILEDIEGGRFPAESSSRTCPNCPAFFLCGAVPSGELRKNLGEF